MDLNEILITLMCAKLVGYYSLGVPTFRRAHGCWLRIRSLGHLGQTKPVSITKYSVHVVRPHPPSYIISNPVCHSLEFGPVAHDGERRQGVNGSEGHSSVPVCQVLQVEVAELAQGVGGCLG